MGALAVLSHAGRSCTRLVTVIVRLITDSSLMALRRIHRGMARVEASTGASREIETGK